MPNHFHLFLKVNDKLNFDKGIKNFYISYSKSINKSFDRVGSLFQGRYKAKKINNDNHYTAIITYIHNNQVEAGLAAKPEDYKYSSYNTYLLNKPTVINKAEVLEWFMNLGAFVEAHKIAKT
ncbi:hypothetical protein GCM10008119_23450 [Pedobacter mendelii]|uniref:Transposase IS200-like domain-containing protein n=1 Tax=Pedobacter mendelii TaxID=1908240 RepID=A0ABQ2BJJ2_9SPHI|nr:hypothetical protein GCM10008119_23450 [Pedobacter mendelii]